MPKDYALRKLYSKEKVIICGCDAISGLLIHHQLDELFGRCEYKILHQYDLQLQKDWEWNTDETTFPGMPHHSRYCGAVSGTSKLINITIIG